MDIKPSSGRAISGTLCVSGPGVRLVSQTTKDHFGPDGEVIFKELIGFELVECFPGAMSGASITYYTNSGEGE